MTDTDIPAKTQTTLTKKSANHRPALLTELVRTSSLDEILRFVVGIILGLTLMGIVGVVLYSLVFVTQPVNSQAPNDKEFFKLITPIATFIVGALSGVMVGKGK
jgi:hypothetical protein